MHSQNWAVRCFLLLGLALTLLGTKASHAQSYVLGVSAVLGSTNSTEIDTFSETFITPDLAYYYGVAVGGYLYQNSTEIARFWADRYPYENDAYGVLTRPMVVGSTYTIESDHYLVAYYVYGYAYGSPQWWNPSGFLPSGGGESKPSGWGFAPGGGQIYYANQYLYLGTTAVRIRTGAPTITSISPSGGSRGKSGSLTINGIDLVDIFTGITNPAITESGVTLSVESATSTQVILSYSVDTNANAGSRTLTLSTRFGTSNGAPFNVGDATPNITSINPNNWQAGATTTFTINGTGFGTNPSVTSNGTGVTISRGAATDTQIQATASVDASSPDQTVTLQVQSNGYGSGFISTVPTQSSVDSKTVTIQAVAAPKPQIMFLGQNIADSSAQSVVLGQQIALTGVIPQTGGQIGSESWSGLDPAATVGGYTASANSGHVVGMPSQTCPTSSSTCNFTYYYVATKSSDQIVFSYTLSNGRSASATATFNVTGPTGDILPNAFVQTNDTATVIVSPTGNPATMKMGNSPARPSVGIFVNDLATLPRGRFIWVQIQNSVTYSQIARPDVGYIAPQNKSTGLDGIYPYPAGGDFFTFDSPARLDLFSFVGEVGEAFDATMYVLWDPAIPPEGQQSCTPATVDTTTTPYTAHPSTCASIPVPLGSVRWAWKACAINQLGPPVIGNSAPTPSWIRQCGPAHVDPPKASGYPDWSSCNKSFFGACQ